MTISLFLTLICQPVSSLHLTDVFLHKTGVEVNDESPGGLGTLSEAGRNRFTDVRVFGALSKAIREPVG